MLGTASWMASRTANWMALRMANWMALRPASSMVLRTARPVRPVSVPWTALPTAGLLLQATLFRTALSIGSLTCPATVPADPSATGAIG